MAEVQGFRDQLKEIQSSTVNGKFLAEDGKLPAGQDIVLGLLNRCLKWSEIVLNRYTLYHGFFQLSFSLWQYLGKEKSMNSSRKRMTNYAIFAISLRNYPWRRPGHYARQTYTIIKDSLTGLMSPVLTVILKTNLEPRQISMHKGYIYPCSNWNSQLKMIVDPSISSATQLCIHLQFNYIFGAGIRGSFTSLQPVANTSSVSSWGQTIRWCFIAQGIISVQHEGRYTPGWFQLDATV